MHKSHENRIQIAIILQLPIAIISVISLLEQAFNDTALSMLKMLPGVFVDEKFQGSVIWRGDIEVFELIGHPKAKRCFAWFHSETGKGVRPVALLERWPIISPQAALRFAIAFDIPVHQIPEPADDAEADLPRPS